jgi:hypothetical protein
MSTTSVFSLVRGIQGFTRSGGKRSGFAAAFLPAILFLLVYGRAASAQSVDFFGSFTSYNQSIVSNAEGIVANAAGGLYVSGTSNLIYIPVDANHDPISSGVVDIAGVGYNCMGLAIDSANNLYRPDPSGQNVQMFTYVGGYSNYASSTPSYIGSGWSRPSAVAVDSSNNVYVLDAGYGTIVKLVPNGSGGFTQTTIYTNSTLLNTTGMSIDSSGNFYIASGPNYGTSPISSSTAAVYKLTNSSGSYTLSSLGSGWNSPSSTAVDFAGNLWVTDYGSGTVYLLTTTNGTSYTQTAYTTISRLRTLTVNKTGEVYGLAYSSGYAVIYAGGSAPHFLGAYNVGTAAPTVTVQVSFPSSTAVSSFSVTTQGTSGLDITNAGTGTCTPQTYAPNSTCTVNIAFTPTAVGVRSGVLQLMGSGGTVLASNYFYGIGEGPVLQFQPASVSTTAGNGVPCNRASCGQIGGTTINLGSSTAMVFDASGNGYIADSGSSVVWKETPGGVFSVVAGSVTTQCSSPTSACGDGGAATSALLNGPTDLAIDGAGNLYIADTGDNRVRVLNLNTGIINAFAGTGTTCPNPTASTGACGDGGTALSATLGNPSGLAVDFYGNVYISDTSDYRIREVAQTTGQITTIAGTGIGCSGSSACGDGATAATAQFGTLQELRFDANGNLYIADNTLQRVRVIDVTSGNINNIAGTGVSCSSPTTACGDGGPATSAQLHDIYGIALDAASNVYIADSGDNRVRYVNTATGVISTVLGTGTQCSNSTAACGDGGAATSATLNFPLCVAFQPTGNVYVCDASDYRIRKLTFSPPSLSFASTTIGSTSTDSPKRATLLNAGNAALTVSVPGSGSNPSLATGFTLDASNTCPSVSSSGSAQSVAVGGSCSYFIDFTPVTAGTDNGSLQLTDNNLGISASQQTIGLSGTGLANVSLLAFGTFPASPVKAGGNAGSAVTVQEENSSDAVVTTATDLITLTVTGPNSYSQTYTSTAVAGVATFNLSTDVLSATGIYTYTASLTGVTSAVATEAVASTSYTPPSGPVGTPSPTQTAVLPFGSNFTLGSISVVTGGATGKDYQVASGGSCTVGTAYTTGSACTVNYTFTPTAPGVRNGAIVITDSSGNVVETVYLTGTGTAPLIGFTPGTASTIGTGLNQPWGLAFDGNGNAFVADYGNNEVKEILASGGYSTIHNLYAVSGATGAALDGAGNLYFCGYFNGSVYEMLASNGYTSATQIASGYTHPFGVAVDGSGDVFVLARNGAVQELPLTGNATYGSAVNIGSGFSNPFGIALDGTGNVYVADTGNGKVKEVLKSGGYSTVNILGSGFSAPVSVAVDGNGNVYVSDENTNKVSEIVAVGGSIPASPTINTLATNSNTPINLTLDSLDNVYYGTNLSGDGIHKLDYSDAPTVTFPTSTIEGLADATDDPLPLTITNNGNANLSFVSAAFGSIFTKDSSTTCSTSSAVAGGASCKYNVDFTPTSVGTNNGTLLLTDNNLNVSATTQTVSFVGTGVTPVTHLVYGTSPATPIILGQGAGTVTVQEENASNVTVTQAVNTITLTVTGPNSYSQTYTATAVAGVATFNLASPTFGNGQAGTYTYTATLTSVTSAVASEVVNLDPTTITWNPPTTSITYGTSLNGLLNASNSQTSNCTYTATPSGQTVTSTTVLGAGTYTMTATCTPTNGTMYAVSTASFTLTIAKATLTVTAASPTITYGGTVPTYTASYSGFQNSDTSSVLSGAPSLTTSPTTPSAAGAYTITAAVGSLTAANYSFSFVNGTLTIAKATLTVTAGSPSITYGTAVPTYTAAYSGFKNSDTSSVLSGAPSLTTSPTTPSAAGTYTITAAVGSLTAANYNFSFVNGTLTINKATLTVTAVSPTITYGTAVPTYTATYSGFQNSDTSSVLSGAPSLTTSPTTPSVAGTYTITSALGTLTAANYNFNFVNGTLTINKATLTVTAVSQAITYGATLQAYTATYSGYQNGDTFAALGGAPSLTTSPTTPSAVGSYTITSALGSLTAANYNFAFANGLLTIGKSTSLVSGLASSAVYNQSGSDPFTFTGEYVGAGIAVPTGTATYAIVNSSSATVASGTITLSTGSNSSTSIVPEPSTLAAGNYTVNVSYGGDGNYLASVYSAALTVTQSPQTITFTPPASPVTFGVSPISLTATASSSLPVSFSVLTGPATISGNTLTITGAGFIQIAANQAGNSNYLAAPQVTQGIRVNPATPGIVWSAPGVINYGTALSATQLNATATGVTGSSLPGTFTYSSALGTVLLPGTQTLTVNFLPTDSVDYLTNSATVTIQVNSATPAIALTATPNPVLLLSSVTAQATVTGVSGGATPTGTVSFYDGTTLLGTAGVSAGVAYLTFAPSVAGTHVLTAVYNGSTSYLTATSTAVSELVQDFNLTISTSAGSATTATVVPGKTATYNLVISPLNAATFPATIALTVSGLPPGATYTLTPSTIAAGSGPTNLTLTVTAANTLAGGKQQQNPLGHYAPFSLALLFLPGLFLSRKMRSKLGGAARLAILMVAGFAAVAGISGCGNSGAGYFGQPSANYTITVTGAAGSLTHSTSVTLTIQ